MSSTRVALAVAACLFAASSSAVADPPTIVYSEVSIPGAVFANAQGINARGDIVGFYRDAESRTHGFVWSRGEVTTIDYPGAAVTAARGIGPDGQIIGSYRMPGEPALNAHGFRLVADGTMTPLDHPDHINTIPQRILPNGAVLGCRHDTDTMDSMRGIVMLPDGTNIETDAFASMHNGATPDGRLVAGLFTNMMTGRSEGYVIAGGQFTPFVVPDSISTSAWDVSPRGEIVGVYRDASNRVHGFLRDGDAFLTIDVPDATATQAFGINAGGDIVGAFVDAKGQTRAFVARRTRSISTSSP